MTQTVTATLVAEPDHRHEIRRPIAKRTEERRYVLHQNTKQLSHHYYTR